MIVGIGHRLIEYDGWECEGIAGTSAVEDSHQPDQGQRNYSQGGIQAPYLCGMRSNFFWKKYQQLLSIGLTGCRTRKSGRSLCPLMRSSGKGRAVNE